MRDISARELKGHNILTVERFQDSTRWMIEFSVLRPCSYGSPGDDIRLFLTEDGYQAALVSQKRREIKIKRYLAQRAELLGAIRLPNDAFKKNAGAEVVSDIIFLQKRDRPLDIVPEWTQTGQTEDGFAINRYFLDHPEMVLGRQEPESTAHGMDYTVNPIEGLELADQLHDAVKYIRGTYQEAELPELGEGEVIDTSIPADPNVKNYSYTVVDGDVYYRENSRMVRPDLNATAEARVKGLVGLRECVQQLIDLQMDAATPDSAIQDKQAELNRLYDSFSAKYGLINDRANRLAFADDSSYYLLCALEVIDEDGKLERMSVEFSAWKQEYTLLLKGQMTHRASLGTDPRGNLTRIDNALAQMPQRLEAVKNQLDNLYQQQAAAKEEIGKPFPFEDDLRVKSARLVELDTLLNIDGKGHAQPETVVAKSVRPSVLDSLKRPVPPRSPEKKPKQHEEVRYHQR